MSLFDGQCCTCASGIAETGKRSRHLPPQDGPTVPRTEISLPGRDVQWLCPISQALWPRGPHLLRRVRKPGRMGRNEEQAFGESENVRREPELESEVTAIQKGGEGEFKPQHEDEEAVLRRLEGVRRSLTGIAWRRGRVQGPE